MASVLVDEELFGALLADRAANQGVSFYVRMGESVLLEGAGEVYLNPTVMSIAPEGVQNYDDMDKFDLEDVEHACDCE